MTPAPWLLLLSLVTGLGPLPPNEPGFLDAPRLVVLCRADGPDAQSARTLCLGYVVGSLDQLLALEAKQDEGRRTICPPQDMTAEDAVRAVVRYSRFAETAKGLGAAGFVKFALEDTYPCPMMFERW